MPKQDGTGPSTRGRGRGKMGGGSAAGPGGNCICPGCGTKVPHSRGIPCNQMKCPECGAYLTREVS